MRRAFGWLTALSVLMLFASTLKPVTDARAQSAEVQAILASMTPEERVGQLFLVTLRGTDVGPDSQIHDLVANYHVGGVVLLAQNNNFIEEPDTIPGAQQLIGALQSIEWEATQRSAEPGGKTYVPLFVGISQEGDGAPHDQILSGLTPLPDAMAIGATWKPELADQVGSVLGRELAALGFNFLLGPSLDVVDSPNPSARSDLGTRVFGGDPFWVGEMGRAYISGLHTGSNGRMVVVAKHFPGRGGSDRLPEEEVATVRKSLEQLKQIELNPFFAVTASTQQTEVVDGLLVSHIRYQGFQGNIRATTRPVSFDATALSTILALPEFSAWRTNGGLIVSDELGSKAVRDFYSQSGESFSPRSVARDAFQAGNDLLYLGDIASDDSEDDNYSATLRVLEYFAQEYQNDSSFARLVDEAVERILAQKLRMYETFEISNVLMPESAIANIGSSQQVMFDVARNGVTLISPDPDELGTLLPAPPSQRDRIVFLTDTPTYQQCSGCLSHDGLAADALQKAVVRLYGPNGSGQIFANRLASFPLKELELMLNGEATTDIEASLASANWIVLSLTDVSNGQISLLRRFFSERPNLLLDKKVILFSFTAPYYLDPTDISKPTAYYALYSKQPAFVDVAARLLFQQISVQGASPVSIPAAGYDLIWQTSPDEDQIIPLSLDEDIPPTPVGGATLTPITSTAVPTKIPLYSIGDTIAVRAGLILDHNQHIVPDGTVVSFIMSTLDEGGGILQQVDTTTTGGIAHASFSIDKPGKVEIRATSEPAMISGVLQFDASKEGAAVTVIVPLPTATPMTATPTVTATPVPENDFVSPEGHPRVAIWLLVVIEIAGGAALAFWAVSRLVSPRWGLRWALCILLGGLAAYNYLALDLPGAAEWIASETGAYGVLLLTFAGEVLGGVVAWIWMSWFSESASPAG